MKYLLLVSAILGYFFSSAFLEHYIVSRATFGDFFLLGLIGFSAAVILQKNRLYISDIQIAALPLFFIYLVGGVFARYPGRVGLELFVMLFSFVGSIALVNLILNLTDKWLMRLFRGYVLVIGFVAFLCLIDYFLFPGLVSSRQIGGIQGPFRNTGQSGYFFSAHASIMIPLLLSRVVPRKPLFIISTGFVIVALIFTIKRASIVALICGIVFLAMLLTGSRLKSDKKIGLGILVSLVVLTGVGYYLFEWALDAVPGLRWRFDYKISVAAADDFAEGFLAENIKSAFEAFGDRPFLGVGLDNVRDVYQSHEIHSTYLGVLAYAGALGGLAYLYFVGNLVRSIWRGARFRRQNIWAAFLYYSAPLLLGQMAGWAYTTHIRKREFWLLVVFVVVAIEVSRRWRSVSMLQNSSDTYQKCASNWETFEDEDAQCSN